MMKRILIALAVSMSVVATFAAAASAATAVEKDAAFRACLSSAPARLMIGGPSVFEECCTKAGGKFDASDGTFSCAFTSDRVAPADSVRPQVIVVVKP
jgi:hypothetical protein